MPKFRPLSETKFINDANLVSYWKLDGNSNDSKGSNNGTDTNISYVAGRYGQAASFNGSSSYINLNSTISSLFSGTNNYSVCTIINRDLMDSNRYIFSSITSTSSNSDYRNFFVTSISDGTLIIGRYDGTTGDLYQTTSVISSSNYYHIVITYNGSTISTYVNGIFLSSLASTRSASAGGNCNIGSYISSNSRGSYFDGLIDDTAIFSRALSASEVNELYQGMTYGEYLGAGSATTKLLLHLNGNSTDSSGNNNNGTVSGATVVDGKFGKCYSFDGTNDVIDLGAGISLTNNFTISLFIKTTNTLNDKSIISKENVGNSFPQFLATLKSNGLITFSVFSINSPSLYISLDSVSAINDGLYKNIILTRDGSFANIYINGKLDSRTAWTLSQWSSTANVCIGASQSSSSFTKFLNCLIDEVIIENRAWSAQEVAKYYTYAKGYYATL